MKRVLILLLAGTAVVVLLVAWLIEHNRAAAIRQEIHALEARLETVSRMAGPSPAPIQSPSPEDLERLRADASEVHKLRNEVNQLRAGANELEKLRAENQQLRAATSARPGPSTPPNPEATAPANFYPKENWTFAGYTTPEATLQSIAWAMREGDVQTLLASVTPEEGERMQKEWGDKSATEVSADVRRGLEKVNSIQVLESRTVSADEVVLSVYAVGGEDHIQRIVLQRSGADWKFAGPKKD